MCLPLDALLQHPSKGEKERYKHLNAKFQRIARRDKKAFLRDQCKEIEESNRMGKTRDLFTMTHLSWVSPWTWLSFIELDKAVFLL